MTSESSFPPGTVHKVRKPTRSEWVFLSTIVLAGIVLRCAEPARMSVEHFDEGVYASNFWFDEADDYRYPDRHLYAPPLLPVLLDWSVFLCGPSRLATMGVGIVFGGLTVVLVWWTARRWFGREAGLAAVILSSLSDFHILYSRTALTDVMLCFWLLLAVHLIWEAFCTRQLRWALAAGVAAGLAWWTKYNGWLALAIALSGLLPWLFLGRRKHSPVGRPLVLWFGMALTACAVWSPVWFDLQSYGGYSVVAANHRQYLVGFSGWFESFIRQFGNHQHLTGWLSCLSVGLAVIIPFLARLWDTGRFTWNALTAALVGMGTAVWFGASIILALIASGAILLGLFSSTVRHRDPDHCSEAKLATWLLAAWFLGLLVSTPLYSPYPRLTLPWLMAAWLGASAAIGWWFRTIVVAQKSPTARSEARSSPNRRMIAGIVASGVFLIVSCVWSGGRLTSRGIPGWDDRTGLEKISRKLIDDARQAVLETTHGRDDIVIYIYAEPALFFHIKAANFIQAAQGSHGGNVVSGPLSNLGFVPPPGSRFPLPIFLAVGPRADRSPKFADEWSQLGGRFQLLKTYRYQPSNLVLLNEYHPKALDDPAFRPEETIRLYLLQ